MTRRGAAKRLSIRVPARADAILRDAFLFLPLPAACCHLSDIVRYGLSLHSMLRLRRTASKKHLKDGFRPAKFVLRGASSTTNRWR